MMNSCRDTQENYQKNDFIKTTYDISLDSLISLFSRGFSPLSTTRRMNGSAPTEEFLEKSCHS